MAPLLRGLFCVLVCLCVGVLGGGLGLRPNNQKSFEIKHLSQRYFLGSI